MRKKLVVVALMVAIAVSFAAYAWAARDEGARAEINQEPPSDATDNPSDTEALEFEAGRAHANSI